MSNLAPYIKVGLTELLDVADHAAAPAGDQIARGSVGGGAGRVADGGHALVHVLYDGGEGGGGGVGGAASRGGGISQASLHYGHVAGQGGAGSRVTLGCQNLINSFDIYIYPSLSWKCYLGQSCGRRVGSGTGSSCWISHTR